MITINKIIANSIVITTGDPELKIPMYFEANEEGASVAMLCWDDYNYQQTDLKCHLQYSTDKMATWATYDGNIVYLDSCTDNRVYFRADPENPNTYGFYKQDWEHFEFWTHYFKTDRSVKAGGNIQFLLESTGTRTDVPASGFLRLFGYNNECTSLTSAPVLPATTLAECCYYQMFSGCTSLTTAPSLPATTLASSCYQSMFCSCTSLTTAPALPATTLADYCYYSMFESCSKLASMDVSFTAWNPSDATTNWVNGVAASGTFTCPAALPKTTGTSNIPSGWTIIEK